MIGFGDKPAPVDAGEIGEIDLFRASLAGEYLAALLRTRGPCTGKIKRVRWRYRTGASRIAAVRISVRSTIIDFPFEPPRVLRERSTENFQVEPSVRTPRQIT